MRKRNNDMMDKMAPPLYSMNSCFFDCAFMALFGSNDEWINTNFLARKIDKEFERGFKPSLHLRANDGNAIYQILHRKSLKNMSKTNIEMLIDFAKTLPQWQYESFPYENKLISDNPNMKLLKKAVINIRNADIKYEIQCKRQLQSNMIKSVKMIREGKQITSMLSLFKNIVIDNKCIPEDEEMRQTIFTYQEQSAISIVRFMFDLFYIKPATL